MHFVENAAPDSSRGRKVNDISDILKDARLPLRGLTSRGRDAA
jgi:hypothetical protein